jgi:hypothetical protein
MIVAKVEGSLPRRCSLLSNPLQIAEGSRLLLHTNVVWIAIVLLLVVGGVAIVSIPESPADSSQHEVSAMTVYTAQAPTENWRWHRKDLLSGSWFGTVTSPGSLQALLATRPFLKGRVPTNVDWAQELLVLAVLGEAPTGGHAVRVRHIVRDGQTVRVLVHLRSPAPEDFVTQVITFPLDVVCLRRDQVPAGANTRWTFVDQRGNVLQPDGSALR